MRSDSCEYSLTDLHTHILPEFDDGADSLETALDMLRTQRKMGVNRVALTSHFYPMYENLESYLSRRQQAYTALLSGWNKDVMPDLRLGAEVRWSPQLIDIDLRTLTIGGGDYLLLELPNSAMPVYMEQMIEVLLLNWELNDMLMMNNHLNNYSLMIPLDLELLIVPIDINI